MGCKCVSGAGLICALVRGLLKSGLSFIESLFRIVRVGIKGPFAHLIVTAPIRCLDEPMGCYFNERLAMPVEQWMLTRQNSSPTNDFSRLPQHDGNTRLPGCLTSRAAGTKRRFSGGAETKVPSFGRFSAVVVGEDRTHMEVVLFWHNPSPLPGGGSWVEVFKSHPLPLLAARTAN